MSQQKDVGLLKSISKTILSLILAVGILLLGAILIAGAAYGMISVFAAPETLSAADTTIIGFIIFALTLAGLSYGAGSSQAQELKQEYVARGGSFSIDAILLFAAYAIFRAAPLAQHDVLTPWMGTVFLWMGLSGVIIFLFKFPLGLLQFVLLQAGLQKMTYEWFTSLAKSLRSERGIVAYAILLLLALIIGLLLQHFIPK